MGKKESVKVFEFLHYDGFRVPYSLIIDQLPVYIKNETQGFDTFSVHERQVESSHHYFNDLQSIQHIDSISNVVGNESANNSFL